MRAAQSRKALGFVMVKSNLVDRNRNRLRFEAMEPTSGRERLRPRPRGLPAVSAEVSGLTAFFPASSAAGPHPDPLGTVLEMPEPGC